MGTAYSGDDRAVQELIDLSIELGEKRECLARDRPMTLTRNMELISRVSEILTLSLPIHEIMEKVLNYVFDLLEGIDRGVIILVDPDPETGTTGQIIPSFKENSDDTVMMYSKTIVDRVLKERKPVSMSDTIQQGRISDGMEVMKIRSVMCVPLISRFKTLGGHLCGLGQQAQWISTQ